MSETQGAMFETTRISAHTADGYQQALKALANLAQEFLRHEDPDEADFRPLARCAREIGWELNKHPDTPRQRMTRCEVLRNALRTLVRAIDEYDELQDHDGVLIDMMDVWERFEREVKSAARKADSYGPDDTIWAPEDDETNPLKTLPAPEPDPTAEVVNGFRQGDWVKSSNDDEPRQILTGIVENTWGGRSIRLSDPRDGGWFGGYFIGANMLGTSYVSVPAPSEREAA